MKKLTHTDNKGKAVMVDVGDKGDSAQDSKRLRTYHFVA